MTPEIYRFFDIDNRNNVRQAFHFIARDVTIRADAEIFCAGGMPP